MGMRAESQETDERATQSSPFDEHGGGLDPCAARDVEGIRALLRQRRQAFPAELRELARRVRDGSQDAALRTDALNVLASGAVVDGDDESGARLFRQALRESWGSGCHGERVACVNLAMILARQRRLVEAFALSRRACRIALATGEKLATCLAHAQLAKVLRELGDDEGFARAVEVAERHRPVLDDTIARWVPHLLAALHAEVAIQRGDRDAADRLLERALDGADVVPEVATMGRAVHLRRTGRPYEALGVIRRALGETPTEPSYRLRFRAEELLCLADTGARDELAERAADCLAEMAREGRRCGSALWRMRVGETVAAALGGHGTDADAGTVRGAREQALRALEIAAVAALERSWEAKVFFQAFPQLERMEPEDVAVIEAHAGRFRAEHRALLDALRALLREGPRFHTPIEPEDGELLVAICAWCNRACGPDHAWIPLEDAVGAAELDVTHGICRTCRSGLGSTTRGQVATPRAAGAP